jgi:hypothetical protein
MKAQGFSKSIGRRLLRMGLSLALGLAAFAAVSPGVVAAAERDSDELDRLWSERYCHVLRVACDLGPSLRRPLAKALSDLEDLSHIQVGYDSSPDFYGIFVSRLRKLSFFSHKLCSTSYAVAFTRTGEISLCSPFFDSATREVAASTLVHEARHLEAGSPGHVVCQTGSNKGAWCDEAFFGGAWRGGGFNADVIYLSWSLRTSNTLSRDVIQSSINVLLPERFNRVADQDLVRWRGDPVRR